MSDLKDKSLALWQSQLPALRLPQKQKQLASQLDRMQYIATVARTAMDELSNNYEYGEFKMHTALAIAAQLRKDIAAGCISPEEKAAYQRDTEEFLQRILDVVQVANAQILQEQQRLPETMGDGSFIDELMSFFSGG